ncbi:MAG: c-type cytochrome [Planctomycetales bacterium]|nr:c-type cytochrome [Planctomycetales bacterium]
MTRVICKTIPADVRRHDRRFLWRPWKLAIFGNRSSRNPLQVAPLLLLLTVCAARAEGVEPFVAGFDRFHLGSPNEPSGGDLLLTELNCTACHGVPSEHQTRLAPKLAPVLTGAGKRLRGDWIASYLLAPHEVKAGGTMPRVLESMPASERPEAARALAAFLAEGDFPEPEVVSTAAFPVAVSFWLKGDSTRGRELYHRVGCVACHDPDAAFQPDKVVLSELEKKIKQFDLDDEDLKELGLTLPQPIRSVPHGDLPAKYTRHSLTLFLLDPTLVRPGGRMPSLKLLPHEAADIAAYLLPNDSAHAAAAKTPELVQRGKALFAELNCGACHTHQAVTSKPRSAKPLAELTFSDGKMPRGCLGSGAEPAPAPGQPRFNLSQPQQTALQSAAARLAQVRTDAPSTEDMLRLTMEQLNCLACHQRDSRGGVGPRRWQFFETVNHVDLGDEGRIPPPLDHVGGKLKQKWLETVFRGKGDVRTHFHARMPVFAQHATQLAKLLRTADQGSIPAHSLELNPRHTEIGRALLDTGCVQCHSIRGESLPGVLGVDLTDVTQRVEPEWFRAFLLNPAEWKKNTRMPTFFPKGKSTRQDIFDGDPEPQIAALWSYLADIEKQPLPDKLEQGKEHNFNLKPTDEPIVLRTFMENSSYHAIAVGFPEGLSYVFDANLIRTSYMWKGGFVNAHSTWFDRFTPLTRPHGVVFPLPRTTFVGKGDEAPKLTAGAPRGTPSPLDLKFRGYRLDKLRVPTMLYQHETYDIEERLAPTEDGHLRRRIQIRDRRESSPPTTFWLAIASQLIRPVAQGEALLNPSWSPTGRVRVKDREQATYGRRGVMMVGIRVIDGKGETEVTYEW